MASTSRNYVKGWVCDSDENILARPSYGYFDSVVSLALEHECAIPGTIGGRDRSAPLTIMQQTDDLDFVRRIGDLLRVGTFCRAALHRMGGADRG